MFQGSVRDWLQMYNFLPWTCICSTYAESSRGDREETEMEEDNRNESPRWWPIMWCWELKWEQKSSSQPEKQNALKRDTVNLSTHLLPSFCPVEECRFGNNWRHTEKGGVSLCKECQIWTQRPSFLRSNRTVRGDESLGPAIRAWVLLFHQ